jgi:hypothetical protein
MRIDWRLHATQKAQFPTDRAKPDVLKTSRAIKKIWLKVIERG